MGEEILAKLRDHQLRRGREQINLNEVEQRLDGEQDYQPERDLVQQCGVGGDEGRVEQVPHDLGEGERNACACDQAQERDYQPPQVWSDTRQQSAQRSWRRNGLLRARRWTLRRDCERRRRRQGANTFRSMTIATNSSAR